MNKMNFDFDYYLIGADDTPYIPLLMPDEGQRTTFLLGNSPAEMKTPLEYCFNPPIPKKPVMADFHQTPSSVFSKKIYDILEPMKIEGLQLIPTVIRDENDELFENYWFANIYNRIACLDRENSEFEISEIDGSVSDIDSFCLDEDKLAEIPLEKRLVFLLAEDMPKRIYHRSVVEAIMAVKPVGIQFYQIADWYEGIQFE